VLTLTLPLTENRGEGPDLSMKGEAFRLKKILKHLILMHLILKKEQQ